jgi:hypothetical protein
MPPPPPPKSQSNPPSMPKKSDLPVTPSFAVPATVNIAVVNELFPTLTAATIGFAVAIVSVVIGPMSILLLIPVILLLGIWLLYSGFRLTIALPPNQRWFRSRSGWLAIFIMLVGFSQIPFTLIVLVIGFVFDGDDGRIIVCIAMVLFGVVCLGVVLLFRLAVSRIAERRPAFTKKYVSFLVGTVIVLGVGLGVTFSLYENRRASYEVEADQRKSAVSDMLKRADSSWKAGQKSEAIEAYTTLIQDDLTGMGNSDKARVFARVIDYLVEKSGPDVARPFAVRAAELELMLILSNPDAIKLYTEVKKSPQNQWGAGLSDATPQRGEDGGAADNTAPNTTKVRLGMTPEQVVEILGQPDDTVTYDVNDPIRRATGKRQTQFQGQIMAYRYGTPVEGTFVMFGKSGIPTGRVTALTSNGKVLLGG